MLSGNELKELFNYPIYQKEIKTFIKTVIRDRRFYFLTIIFLIRKRRPTMEIQYQQCINLGNGPVVLHLYLT